MAMQIQNKGYITIFSYLCEILLDIDRLVHIFIFVTTIPSSIQIHTG